MLPEIAFLIVGVQLQAPEVAIAAKPGLSADQLRAAMNPQHSRMPDFALSRRQQDDLIAYIHSLRVK